MKITNQIKSPNKFDVTELITFLAKELNIKEIAQLTIAYNEELLNKISNGDVTYQALLQNPTKDVYYLFVTKTKLGLNKILCHEMVHLSQCDRGDLQLSNDFRKITWKGKVFDNSKDYRNREWEEEAFSLENKLWRKFKKWKSSTTK